MRFNVGVMIGKGLHALREHALFANPLEGLALEFLVLTDSGGNHLLPGLAGIATVGEEQDELAFFVPNLDSAKTGAVAGDVDHRHGAVTKEVV